MKECLMILDCYQSFIIQILFMNNPIASTKIKIIYELLLSGIVNITSTARKLKTTRNTIKKYISELRTLIIVYPDQLDDFGFYLARLKKPVLPGERLVFLQELFPAISRNILLENSKILDEWKKYKNENPDGFQYSQFNNHFTEWCNFNGVIKLTNRWRVAIIAEEDFITLRKWRRCSNKAKWEKAVIILESYKGKSLKKISQQVERSTDQVKEWIRVYSEKGLAGMNRKVRKRNEQIIQNIETKKSNLMRLLHETPKLHSINRASWSLLTLATAYKNQYKTSLSTSTISEYIRESGFSFRKAKETLTSPDPHFREKLNNITNILSNLTSEQKFFSVDEFGPFAVKIKGGRSYVRNGELKTFPQLQRSKGCIICTAALELSENQITHFYSQKKNTDEMIKLLEILLIQYRGQQKIFFSWDAASWHASKKLYKKIEEVNDEVYRSENKTPIVELAPLPSSAQFLNVIESVFSGLAKAIIHNSDYSSADECKSAIDLYFKERNEYFITYPKKAGNKIWGKELVIPIFDETKNFKDPRWR
jgi:transposase